MIGSTAGVICVAGMHRSGTSLTTRMLVALGMDIGPEDTLVEPDPVDNPDGYQEQRAFVEFHDELLRELGGHASEPPDLAQGWQSDERLDPYRETASRLLETTFTAHPCGFKDPRASLLLPFWRSVEPDLRVVVCRRDPSDVAASMLRRNGPYDRDHWLAVAARHTADALRDSEGLDRLVVDYEAILADPAAASVELGRFLLGREPETEPIAAAAALPVR